MGKLMSKLICIQKLHHLAMKLIAGWNADPFGNLLDCCHTKINWPGDENRIAGFNYP